MLQANHLIGFGAGGGKFNPQLQTVDVFDAPTSGSTTQTFSGVEIGPADLWRFVLFVIGGESTTVRTVSSVSINAGAIAGFKYAGAAQGGTQRGEIWGAWIPTGTTCDVAVTWSGSGMASQLVALAFKDWKSASAAFSTQIGVGVVSADNVVDVPPNGWAISVRQQNGAQAITWTNATEVAETSPPAGSQTLAVAVREAGPSGDSGITINSTVPSANDAVMLTVCFFGDGPPVEYGDAAINLAGNTADLAAGAARTFAGAATIDFDERALIAVMARGNAGSLTSTSLTVGGQAATKLASRNNDLAANNIVEWYLAPVGASGDVVHTVGGASTLRGACAVYPIRAASLQSNVPVFTGSDDTRLLQVSNVPYKSGGIVLGASFHNDDSTVTWTGLGEDTDGAVETQNRCSSASAPWWPLDGTIALVQSAGGATGTLAIDTLLVISLR